MCIEVLVEALRAEDYTIQSNAVKLMQVLSDNETITWNKFFTGNENCHNYKEYKERLDVHKSDFVVVDNADSQSKMQSQQFRQFPQPL